MKRAAIAVLLLAACQRAAPVVKKTLNVTNTTTNAPSNERRARENDLIEPTRKFLDSAKLGAKLGPDGAVAQESHQFVEGQPIYFTMNISESPVGLQTRASWLDEHGKEIVTELRRMNGAKTATFAMTKRLAPGVYRVEGYWGGNFAAEKVFEVVKKR